MTPKFIRWNCLRCDAPNVAPLVEGTETAVLRCASCQYVNDPLDDTWPRPENGSGEEEDSTPKLRMTRRPGSRPTPG